MIPGGEGQQLKLFMTGVELQDSITDSIDRNPIGGFGRSLDDMWKSKLRQAKRPDTAMNHGAGVYKSIKDNGYVGRTDTPESRAASPSGIRTMCRWTAPITASPRRLT
jgi:hypothetical protein